MTGSKPSKWPTDVAYIRQQCYHASVPPDVVSYICGTGSLSTPGSLEPQARSSLVVARRITAPSHPACGQYGVFAVKKIPPQTRIFDYIGEVHADDRKESDYDISLYRTQDGLVNVGIDASAMGNEARFINDYRGVQSRPNAVFQDGRTVTGELRMSVWSSSQPIKKGEEILVSYGKAWWRARSSGSSAEFEQT